MGGEGELTARGAHDESLLLLRQQPQACAPYARCSAAQGWHLCARRRPSAWPLARSVWHARRFGHADRRGLAGGGEAEDVGGGVCLGWHRPRGELHKRVKVPEAQRGALRRPPRHEHPGPRARTHDCLPRMARARAVGGAHAAMPLGSSAKDERPGRTLSPSPSSVTSLSVMRCAHDADCGLLSTVHHFYAPTPSQSRPHPCGLCLAVGRAGAPVVYVHARAAASGVHDDRVPAAHVRCSRGAAPPPHTRARRARGAREGWRPRQEGRRTRRRRAPSTAARPARSGETIRARRRVASDVNSGIACLWI